ncbi:MAG: FecR domain-containing protein [Tannerellaceae bacterium]|jgi:ferric-dicitrate binding protein FerR (iron transport regulator)|nr:FecR domain-containing protein [Tannerellaceae bacterium]
MEQEIEKIILRNLSGEASAEEHAKLSEWIVEKEANKQAFFQLKAYWDAKLSGVTMDKDAAWEQLFIRIRKSKSRRLIGLRWLKYAGVAMIAAVFSAIATYWGLEQREAPAVEYFSYASGNASSSFRLPDGTDLVLNKQSTLKYSNLYGEKVREVSLEGEAFFEVKPNTEKAFILRLGDSRITVLGTTFNVRNYAEENILRATLVEGLIRFDSPQRTVVLKPKQELSYDKQKHETSLQWVETQIATAWKENLLRYKSISFAEFLKLLEKHYEVEILLQNKILGQQKVSGSFDTALSVEQILELTKKSLSFDWEKKANDYIIK